MRWSGGAKKNINRFINEKIKTFEGRGKTKRDKAVEPTTIYTRRQHVLSFRSHACASGSFVDVGSAQLESSRDEMPASVFGQI